MTFRKTDAQLREVMPNILDYVDAIQILKVIEVDDDGKHYDTEGKGMKDTSSISIYSYYHETITDPGEGNSERSKTLKSLQTWQRPSMFTQVMRLNLTFKRCFLYWNSHSRCIQPNPSPKCNINPRRQVMNLKPTADKTSQLKIRFTCKSSDAKQGEKKKHSTIHQSNYRRLW